MRKDVLAAAEPSVRVELSGGGMTEVRIVESYVHLGGVVCHDGTFLPDIRCKAQQAEKVFRRLRAKLLKNAELGSDEKINLLNELVVSKLTVGAGHWHFETQAEWKEFH